MVMSGTVVSFIARIVLVAGSAMNIRIRNGMTAKTPTKITTQIHMMYTWRSNICSPIGVTGGCRLYSRAARAVLAISADASIAARRAVFATSLTAGPTRCAALMRSMLSLEKVDDARKTDAL